MCAVDVFAERPVGQIDERKRRLGNPIEKNNPEKGRKNNPKKKEERIIQNTEERTTASMKFSLCLLVSLYISLPVPLHTRHRHQKKIMVAAGIDPVKSAC
jgi:hypothetical protein